MPPLLADDQQVDVAADIVVATRIGTEHERVANARIALEERAELCDQTDGSRVQVAERRIHRIRGIHVPHSQRTDAPTLDESLPEELLKGQLYGARAPMDPPNEVSCMELLARCTREQREQAGFGPRSFDIGHELMIHLYRTLIRSYLRVRTPPPVRFAAAHRRGSSRTP